MIKTRIFHIILSIFAGFSVMAQDALEFVQNYRYQEYAPLAWSSSSGNAISWLGMKDLTSLDLNYDYQNNSFRYFEYPEQLLSFKANAEGFKTIGNTSFRGHFTYLNSSRKDLHHNHMSFPVLDTPFKYGDKNGGDYLQEDMNILGNISHPINASFQVGILLDYWVRMGSKQRNVRNLNTVTDLQVSPGVSYIRKDKKHSFDIILTKRTELIEARSYSNTDVDQNYIYHFVGLGLTKGNPELIDSYTSTYYNNALGGRYSFYRSGKKENLTELQFDFEDGSNRKGSDARQIFGTTALYSLSLWEQLRFKNKSGNEHLVAMEARVKSLQGTPYDQKKDIFFDEYGFQYYEWITVGKPEPKYKKIEGCLALKYNRLNRDEENQINLVYGAVLTTSYLDEKRTPVTSHAPSMTVANVDGNLFIQKFFYKTGFSFSGKIDVTYRNNLMKDVYFESRTDLLEEYLIQNFNYLSSNLFLAKLSIGSDFKVGGNQMFFNINTSYCKPFDYDIEGANRFGIITTLGIIL